MKKRLLLYGFLSWLVPFLVSIPFYSRGGELSIDIFLFKSIMIITGSLISAFLFISYFKLVASSYLWHGVQIGVIWFLMNLLLDFVVLLPMSGMPLGTYMTQIGMRYLVIPITSITIGKVLQNSSEQASKK